jgi:hypothetical protein
MQSETDAPSTVASRFAYQPKGAALSSGNILQNTAAPTTQEDRSSATKPLKSDFSSRMSYVPKGAAKSGRISKPEEVSAPPPMKPQMSAEQSAMLDSMYRGNTRKFGALLESAQPNDDDEDSSDSGSARALTSTTAPAQPDSLAEPSRGSRGSRLSADEYGDRASGADDQAALMRMLLDDIAALKKDVAVLKADRTRLAAELFELREDLTSAAVLPVQDHRSSPSLSDMVRSGT